MEILAKPKGISLVDHVNNVLAEAEKLAAAHPFVLAKYQRLAGRDLWPLLEEACRYHDEGKKHPVWQKACQDDYAHYQKFGRMGIQLRKSGIRHEIESLKMVKGLDMVVAAAIAAHHSFLCSEKNKKKRWLEQKGKEDAKGEALWKQFQRESNRTYNMTWGDILGDRYAFSGIRAYLQWADRRASIMEDGRPVPPFTGFGYRFAHPKKRPVQELVEAHWQEKLLLLRAPTGAGKTDACLIWAQKQVEHGRADRLVIAMPTRFTSNALKINVAETLSSTGLYHSSAFASYFKEVKGKRDPEAEHWARVEQEFAQYLETPITVCTVDHLLIAQTQSREAHHGVGFNLAHSCVVVDEADFYDEFTQGNLLMLLKILQKLDVPVLMMSASLPNSTLNYYRAEGLQCSEVVEDRSDLERVRCRLEEMRSVGDLSEMDDWLEGCTQQPSIIYANTIDRAMQYYRYFQEHHPEQQVILYHSRFTEEHKTAKEGALLAALGREAWQEGRAEGIAILTQIGEMSVNISADYMISDLCPIDRLVQRVGRLSRFGQVAGCLRVVVPQKDGAWYPAPYASRQKKEWQPQPAMLSTYEKLRVGEYTGQDFVDLVNEVYPFVPETKPETLQNMKEYEKQILQNWLIVPGYTSEVDEQESTCSGQWKSRNIDTQFKVFVVHPLAYLGQEMERERAFFERYLDFRFYENEGGIDCPHYVFHKAIKEGKIHQLTVEVGDEERKIFWVDRDYYTEELGLYFDAETEANFI